MTLFYPVTPTQTIRVRKNLAVLALLISCLLLNGCSGQLTQPEQAVWIDVRTQAEYDSGHLQPALNIPHDTIEEGVAPLALAPDTPVYLYCGSGRRAGLAKERLEALGFTRVTNAGSLESARELLNENQEQLQ